MEGQDGGVEFLGELLCAEVNIKVGYDEVVGAYRLPEEHNIGLNKTPAPPSLTSRDFPLFHCLLHLSGIKRRLAIYTSLRRETSVGLDDFIFGYTCETLEGIDVLGEASV